LDAMDNIAPLATQVASLLAPFLPQLVKTGQALAEGVVDQVVKQKGDVAQALWDRLFPKMSEASATGTAVRDAAANPDDPDYQAALRVQLRKLLTEDRTLAEQLREVVESGEKASVNMNVSAGGERSVAVGGSVQGSTIVTGDKNRLTP
jgi:hypothetical protein